ncbi:MAG: anthranilate phosphoribosyltransferase [Methanomicrobiales archaeon]|nr:anthranilate phosphoribosyltransferase [Methanomicrobiales archaeon]
MLTAAIATLGSGRTLAPEDAEMVMECIMRGGATPAQMGAILMGLKIIGETPEEIAAFARTMRRHAERVETSLRPLVDTCGTGGDASGTFNISTAAAFVAAGAGIPVVKHGNRGVSSRCGSADVLEALGVHLNLPSARLPGILECTGIVFLFAPNHHPSMRYVAQVRRELGIPSIFNLLGPLANPAGAGIQLVGVGKKHLVPVIAETLRLLGSDRAMVVHGSGLDEITTTGDTFVAELDQGKIQTRSINPEQFGFVRARLDDLTGGDIPQNAALLRSVLAGNTGPRRDIVLLNAGAVIYLSGFARSIEEGIEMGRTSIDSGAAMQKLETLRAASQEAADAC